MRILLIGEFSGVHFNLRRELLALGHYVKLGSDGDSYRKLESDFKLAPFKGRLIGRTLNLLYFMINIRKFIGYDVIQFISPFAIPYHFHFFGITRILFKLNNRKIYYACGTDPAYMSTKDQFRYFPLDGRSSPTEYYPSYNKLSMTYYNWFINNVTKIVPSMYSYYLGYKKNSKVTSQIPLPGGNKIGEAKVIARDAKIKILFGITRRDFKGSKFIVQALDRVRKVFSDKVEIIIVEHLALKEYLDYLKEADILIDQCKSYDYGMNAIFGMQNGCIVLSGFEKEAISYSRFKGCPIINITPSADDIFDKIESICMLKKEKIVDLKKQSLFFVKENHSAKQIAESFIKLYQNSI
ncbi:hypothetical protein OAF97_01400 [Akkermansiaceae bacterium]|nr:hypothetical protein [Akkermansiaceae bacterium]